jgi:hypothetical protein
VHVVRACFLVGRIRSDLHLQVVRAVWFERLAFVAASQDAAALCMAQLVVVLLVAGCLTRDDGGEPPWFNREVEGFLQRMSECIPPPPGLGTATHLTSLD